MKKHDAAGRLPRFAILGAPGSGKSSLMKCLVSLSKGSLQTCGLDDDIESLARKHRWPEILTDAHVDEAVAHLLQRAATLPNVVIEMPHHDYMKLISSDRFDLTSYDCCVVLRATLHTLLKRNRVRVNHPPDLYVVRCYGSTEALIEYLGDTAARWLVADSDLHGSEQLADLAWTSTRRTSSPHLKKLAILPVPKSPYLGGHLVNSVEWSHALVAELIRRFDIRTALDVGCGIGLSLDRFHDLGVSAWGLEGNPRVLNGPCQAKERLFIVDFTQRSVQLPLGFDLVWCTEVLEHVHEAFVENVLRTIVENARHVVFVSAAGPGDPGYHHVNCRPKAYWIKQFEDRGLRYAGNTPELLSLVSEPGPFGENPLRKNGMLFEVRR